MDSPIKRMYPLKKVNSRHCDRLFSSTGLVISLLIISNCCRAQASRLDRKDNQQAMEEQSTAISKYREPSNWLIKTLMSFFEEIDWQAIAVAREQVEKFIRSVDRVLTAFKMSKGAGGSDSFTGKEDHAAGPDNLARIFSSSWWASNAKASGSMDSDSTNLKAMLERVACFVGYMRLLNHSNEALAELDASKVVSNLFNASKKNSSWSWWG